MKIKKMQPNLRDGYVLITGASGGIGSALARQLIKKGYTRLILTGRDADVLTALSHECLRLGAVDAIVLPCDLSEPDAAKRLFAGIISRVSNISIIINNAGLGDYTTFVKADPQKISAQIAINISALTMLTRFFAEHMKSQGYGAIVNIASFAGFFPTPFMAVYAATKAYVLSFSHAVAAELKNTNVTVSVVCPGNVKTGFHAVAGISKARIPFTMSAEKVASIVINNNVLSKSVQIIPHPFLAVIKTGTSMLSFSWIARFIAHSLKSGKFFKRN
jgi:short-subunit dehydrogenase